MEFFLLFSLVSFFISMTYYLYKIYDLLIKISQESKEEDKITRESLNEDVDVCLRELSEDN